MHKIIFIIFSTLLTLTLPAQTIRTGTYNIRYKNAQDSRSGNGWEKRCPQIVRQIDSLRWDVFGAQEVLFEQLTDLCKALPDFAYKGVGREDGKRKGEFAPVFYNKRRFECLASGTFWLSETDSIVSTGWDAALPRICTWVQLREKSTHQTFWFWNCHLDHKGVEARRESLKLILQKIHSTCNDDPVVLTGDFNTCPESTAYQVLASSELLRDSYIKQPEQAFEDNTFNNFQEASTSKQRIDYVFVSARIKITAFTILNEQYKDKDGILRYPSDHFPVSVSLDIR